MSSSEITAILNLVAAIMPMIEQGAITLVADVQRLLSRVHASADATPAQIDQAKQLYAASDAAQDKAYAAYQAMATPGA